MCPRLSSWAYIRLVCEVGLLAKKRCPIRWNTCRDLDEGKKLTTTDNSSAFSFSESPSKKEGAD